MKETRKSKDSILSQNTDNNIYKILDYFIISNKNQLENLSSANDVIKDIIISQYSKSTY